MRFEASHYQHPDLHRNQADSHQAGEGPGRVGGGVRHMWSRRWKGHMGIYSRQLPAAISSIWIFIRSWVRIEKNHNPSLFTQVCLCVCLKEEFVYTDLLFPITFIRMGKVPESSQPFLEWLNHCRRQCRAQIPQQIS